MNKLLRRLSLLLAFSLLCSVSAGAQVPRLGDVKTIVVADDNFVVQKANGPVFRRSITCEAWITTDGKLHCKTVTKLTSASVKFTLPTISSTTSGGGGTSAGGDISRKLAVKEPVLGQDTYIWDISGDKYRDKHSITLFISSAFGSGEIVLINKKIPGTVQH